MPTNNPAPTDPASAAKPMLQEADIGSGERTPGQLETDRIVKEIPALPHDDEDDGDEAGGPAERG